MPNIRNGRIWVYCDQCGLRFSINPAEMKRRLMKSKTGLLYHSNLCHHKHQRGEVPKHYLTNEVIVSAKKESDTS